MHGAPAEHAACVTSRPGCSRSAPCLWHTACGVYMQPQNDEVRECFPSAEHDQAGTGLEGDAQPKIRASPLRCVCLHVGLLGLLACLVRYRRVGGSLQLC